MTSVEIDPSKGGNEWTQSGNMLYYTEMNRRYIEEQRADPTSFLYRGPHVDVIAQHVETTPVSE